MPRHGSKKLLQRNEILEAVCCKVRLRDALYGKDVSLFEELSEWLDKHEKEITMKYLSYSQRHRIANVNELRISAALTVLFIPIVSNRTDAEILMKRIKKAQNILSGEIHPNDLNAIIYEDK